MTLINGVRIVGDLEWLKETSIHNNVIDNNSNLKKNFLY